MPPATSNATPARPPTPSALPATLPLPFPSVVATLPPAEAVAPAAAELALRSLAPRTVRVYGCYWAMFKTWCERQDPPLPALPAAPATVALYLTALATTPRSNRGRPSPRAQRSVGTIDLQAAAIAWMHRTARAGAPCADPAVQRVLAGIRRTFGRRPTGAKDALTLEDLARLVKACDLSRARGIRNRAILLLGFAGAFRRDELVSLAVADLEPREKGLLVLLRVSKTDQEQEGRIVPIPASPGSPYCPVQAVLAWLAVLDGAGMELDGPLFRPVTAAGVIGRGALDGAAVAQVVKACAVDADFPAAKVVRLAGHSLRAGFVTVAAQGGAPEWAIAKTTGHRDLNVLRRYIRAALPFQDAVKVL